MFVQRHDLIAIAAPARQQIWQALPACAANWPQNELKKLVLFGYDGVFVPGIVRRQENALPGQLQIGLSAPYRQDGRRLRMAATIPVAAAGARLTPYQAALLPPDKTRRESALYRLLSAVLAVGEELGIPCGVYGSLALELATGLPYCHADSDLDLIVRYQAQATLPAFYARLCRLEAASGIRIDAELALCGGYGVKLKEFFSDSHYLLAKGFTDVRSLERAEAVIMENKEG